MSLTSLPLRVAAMEAVIVHRFSYRRVREVLEVSRGSLVTWLKAHREEDPSFETLFAKVLDDAQQFEELTRLRQVVAESSNRRNRRGKVKEVEEETAKSNNAVVIELRGTIDGLKGVEADAAELMSDLVINDETGCVNGRVTFRIPIEVARRLRIDDRLVVTITAERAEQDG